MSILRASSASRRVACPGSRALEEQIAKTRPYKRNLEHETARWVALELLKGNEIVAGQFTEDLEVVTQEMVDCGIAFRDYVNRYTYPLSEFIINNSYEIYNYKDTIDAIVMKEAVINIFEYKYGHKYVRAFENWEMISYAAGVVHEFPDLSSDATFRFHIFQPRCFFTKQEIWSISHFSATEYFGVLRRAEREALTSKIQQPSSECSNCTGRSQCEALQTTARICAGIAYCEDGINVLKAPEIGNELRYLKQAQTLLNARITGLEVEAESLLKNGECVPYFKLESTQGKQIWNMPPEEIAEVSDILNINIKKPLDILTPKQAIKAGLPKDIVDSFSEIKLGTPKLVQYESNEGEKIFNNLIDTSVNND